VASALEMRTALDTPMPAARVSFAGPGKTRAELAQAVAAGVQINVESESEVETVAGLARTQGARPPVAIRINPDFELKSSGMRMGGGAKQFGVDAERVPQLLKRLAALPLDFRGFHIFAGSQNLRPDSIRETQEKTIALAADLARHAPAPVRHLNIGGGFGIPYFPGDQPLDIGPIGAALGRTIEAARAQLPEAEIHVELGRYIVGEAGVYVCRVVDRKESRGQVFLITDGGLNHQLAASGRRGVQVRRLRADREPDRVPEPPGAGGGAGLAARRHGLPVGYSTK
jgi:diaminopimelate decarboxylase